MGKLIYSMMMSGDGYVEDEHGRLAGALPTFQAASIIPRP